MTHPPALARILVADDQRDVLEALRLLLSDSGYAVDFASSVDAVVQRVALNSYELALIDLNYSRDTTSGREGLELVSRLRQIDASLPVVVMTGWGSIDTAVEAMRRGARSFVQKPWDDGKLLEILQREIEEARTRRRDAARVQREADEAQAIQRRLLPVRFPDIAGLRIAATWRPASGFGGDCFDVLGFSRGRVGLVVADVAGKGLPAALLMSNLQAAVRAFADDETEPRVVSSSVNRLLCRNMISGRFVTFCYLRLDTIGRRLVYTNAGHNPPFLIRQDGGVERLTAGGMVLGVFADARYTEAEVAFEPGDRLFVYTDGITEARNAAGDEYGDDRLLAAARRMGTPDTSGLESSILDDVLTFSGGTLEDDATLLVAALESS